MNENNQNNHSQNYFLNLLNSEDFTEIINSFQEQYYSPSPSYINGFSVIDDTVPHEPAIPISTISDHNYQPQYDPAQLILPFQSQIAKSVRLTLDHNLQTKKKNLLTKISELKKEDNLSHLINLQNEIVELEEQLDKFTDELVMQHMNLFFLNIAAGDNSKTQSQ